MIRQLNPFKHLRAFQDIILLLTSHRQLTWEMTKREICDKYAGQVFGTLWVIGHPLIIMAVYVLVFAFVFKFRMEAVNIKISLDYTTFLLSGLLPWLCMQEILNKSSGAILQEKNLVKQIVFPIEILPVKCVLATLPTLLITSIILVAYVVLKHRVLPWTYTLLPVLIIFQSFGMIGIAYILSSIGVFLRDLKDIIQVFTFVSIFVLPIFYIPDQTPPLFYKVLYLNPFSYMVWCYHDVCYYGDFIHWWAWPVFAGFSLLTFYLGYRLFYKFKHMFGNVL